MLRDNARSNKNHLIYYLIGFSWGGLSKIKRLNSSKVDMHVVRIEIFHTAWNKQTQTDRHMSFSELGTGDGARKWPDVSQRFSFITIKKASKSKRLGLFFDSCPRHHKRVQLLQLWSLLIYFFMTLLFCQGRGTAGVLLWGIEYELCVCVPLLQACTLARRNAEVFLKYIHRNNVSIPGAASHARGPEQQVKGQCCRLHKKTEANCYYHNKVKNNV